MVFITRRAVFFPDVEELLIQYPPKRVKKDIVCGDIGLGKRFMEGSQVGVWRNIRTIERITFVDNRDLTLFNHGNKEQMKVEGEENKVSRKMQMVVHGQIHILVS